MIYKIKINERTFEVEIEDINKRPVVAHVNGQKFLVQPESNQAEEPAEAEYIFPPKQVLPGQHELHDGVMVAPLPGTVIEVFIKQGDTVEAGQVILIIEAMKMKNSIRSTKDGIVAAVLVSAGQTVTHKQTLVEFEA
jgi:glutaconyl-CoA/methylmalonyl-CoA decarboxylase subunit gamma